MANKCEFGADTNAANPNKSAAGSVPLDHAGYADKAVGSEEAFE